MKRKMRKFQMGGPTSYADSGSAGGSNISFKDAFREARKAGLDSFTWRGKKYTTEVASSKKSDDAEPTKVKKTETMTEVETPVRAKGYRGSKPGMARVGTGRYDDPTSTYGERVTAPFRKLGDLFGLRKEEKVMRNMGVSRDEARRRLEEKEDVEEMRHGGRVKKMAQGGKVPEPVEPLKKGPQGPRRYPGQNEAARERRQEEMSRKMREARERFDKSSESDTPGYKRGGGIGSASKRADGCAVKGKTRGRMI